MLMKATRAAASCRQALRFVEVRRSSSMMPSLTVFSFKPSKDSTRPNNSTANATSFGPCIFGLTIYTEPARVLQIACEAGRRKSWSAMVVVTTASRIPSGISLPSPIRIAGLVIRWPTLRKNSNERPCSFSALPSAPLYSRSGLSVR